MDERERKESYGDKPDMVVIDAFSDQSEWEMDQKGYFLIDPRPEEGLLYAHHYLADGKYHVSVRGKSAQDVYYTLLREGLVGSLQHAAYLGVELHKAELVVKLQLQTYVQDDDLVL